MLGFTPPEWAYYATQQTGIEMVVVIFEVASSQQSAIIRY